MTTDDTGTGTKGEIAIDYDNRVQEALRRVIKDVLTETAENGLPGDHHFYITFKTRQSGVNLPERLIARYPDEMTIVLQHKYWSLTVDEEGFSVGLSFDRQVETLHIPYEAIVGFVDPSVKFALQFQEDDFADIDDTEMSDEDSLPESAGIHDGFFKAEHELARQEHSTQEEQSTVSSSQDTVDPAKESDSESSGDNVVTLDAFRKK